jgi:uncharacterized protein (UPF0548 family)
MRWTTGLRPRSGAGPDGHDGLVITSLSPDVAAALRAAPFTYAEVGATAGAPPTGYRPAARSRVLRRADLSSAADRLMTWRAHEGAGLRVAASSRRAEPGAVVLMLLGIGPVALRIPCRVVYVVDEPDRVGFAYGSLPGHPVSGEELFVVQRNERGQVAFSVTAFSKPATRLMRLGGPLARWAQDRVTDRYLSTSDRA